jgi:SAM-dependent methyltransferase
MNEIPSQKPAAMAPVMEIPGPAPTRRELALTGIDVAGGIGLEFGPLDRPLVEPQQGRIFYLDHMSTAGLREKYRLNAAAGLVDLDRLAEIHFVFDGRPLKQLVADAAPFDYVIASHVIEHIANPVQWLLDIAEVLTEDGKVSLIIPDRRFTFDHFRTTSSTGELLDAYLAGRTQAAPGQVYDHIANAAEVEPAAIWRGEAIVKRPVHGHTAKEGLRVASLVSAGEAPPDIHVFTYTPWSFARSLRELMALAILPYTVSSFTPTGRNGMEFHVILQKAPKDTANAASVPVLDPALHHALPTATEREPRATAPLTRPRSPLAEVALGFAHMIPKSLRAWLVSCPPVRYLYARVTGKAGDQS